MNLCYLYLIPILIIILLIISYYRFANLNKKLREIFDSMDIYLTKRWNSIPSILDYLKNDSQKDETAYNKVKEMLSIEYKKLSSEEKVLFNNEIEHNLDILIQKTFNSSDMNANELFNDIREEHIKVEKNLDNIEKYYNNLAIKFNNRVNRFPSLLVAKLFRFKEKNIFNPSILNNENNN
ncbi:MAG: LemA family protein [Bacilli bacterium]|nr:LemA family protein [Bacilli bacterium]